MESPNKLTVPQLRKWFKDRGIKVKPSARKPELINLYHHHVNGDLVIQDLPSEMLYEIIRHTDANTRRAAMRTSKAWRKVVETYPLELPLEEYIQKPERYQIFVIRSSEIKNGIPVPYTTCGLFSSEYDRQIPGRILPMARGGGVNPSPYIKTPRRSTSEVQDLIVLEFERDYENLKRLMVYDKQTKRYTSIEIPK